MNWKLVLFAWFCLPVLAQGQDAGADRIFLKNGEVIIGEIVSYAPGDTLRFRLTTGKMIAVPDTEVARIKQHVPEKPLMEELAMDADEEPEKVRKLPRNGRFNSTFISILTGENRFGNFTIGTGIHNITGLILSPGISLGLGIGVDNYARRAETIVPVYVHIRMAPYPNRILYFGGSVGYGQAFKREKFNVFDARGGLMAHPVVGFQIPGEDGAHVLVDLGVQFQKASYTERLRNNDIEFRDVVFKRATMRVALNLWSRRRGRK